MRPVADVIPHRPPFLFIEEVLDLTDTRVLARSRVTGEEPHLAGHYPGKPIQPGVILCETVLQAGAYLLAERLQVKDPTSRGVPVVSRMNNVKFKKMVKPGDVLEVKAELERSMLGAHFMKGEIRRGGELMMTLDFVVMLAEEG